MSTLDRASAASDVYKRQVEDALTDMRNRRGENAKALGAFMGGGMFKTLVSEIGADVDGDGLPDLWEKRGNQGAPQLPALGSDVANALALLAANPQLLSLVRPVDAPSISTHAPQPPAHPPPRQWQGSARRSAACC